MNKKIAIIFTGPSGVGKQTLENRLFEDESLKLQLSCSATTRDKRVGEIDGQHYHFITHEAFNNSIADNAFIEWAEHFNNKYGTLISEIDRITDLGRIPILEIETVGAKNVINNLKNYKIISFFISPPSFQVLEERIRYRATEGESQILLRLEKAREELGHVKEFDYEVINDNVERAVNEIKKIIKGIKYEMKS